MRDEADRVGNEAGDGMGNASSGDQCGSAAAYVLGALSSTERHEFEVHLEGCAQCRRTVAEFAGIPGLLSRVSPADLAEPDPVPETLLPRLLREVRRHSMRRRLVLSIAAAATVAAAVLVGATVGPDQGAPDGTAMTALVSAPITATADLHAEGGGTRIDMTCEYYGGTAGDLPPYDLVVTGRDGSVHRVARWRVGPDGSTRVVGSVALSPTQISRVEVRTAAGTPILRLQNTR